MEYNRGRLGRGQLHVLIALARGSGCMMHTILGGLQSEYMCVAYNVLLVPRHLAQCGTF